MIPARYSASRFPAKLMQNLGGETVIYRTYQATVNTDLFDEVYVVTDSEIIYDEILKNSKNIKNDPNCFQRDCDIWTPNNKGTCKDLN